MIQPEIYKTQNNIRIITATSLFDGHDATINIIRRIIQSTGGEVIHLGHNKSVDEIVNCAIQEDAQAIAVTSYQGGHIEFYKYMYDLLQEKKCGHIKIFGGGGGVILPDEKDELLKYGIAGIYSPDDGRTMGLQGMINDLMQKADFPLGAKDVDLKKIKSKDQFEIASLISKAENYPDQAKKYLESIGKEITNSKIPIVGITGTGGAGKSSIVDEIIRRFLDLYPDLTIGIVSVDPSKRKSGGALLGDRIRMNSINHPNVYMRSLATRQQNLALSAHVKDAVEVLKYANYDVILLESSGIGQSDTEIIDQSDVYFYVMTPDYGAASQLEKIAMLDYADIIALNKFDKQGALDALRDVKKQYQRNNLMFETPVEEMPVYGTVASQYNNEGLNILFQKLISILNAKTGTNFPDSKFALQITHTNQQIVPPGKSRYLSDISDTIRNYNQEVDEKSSIANRLQAFVTSGQEFKDYCQKEIFTPSGMKNTFYTIDTASYFARGAKPYRWVGSKTYYEYPVNYLQAGGAGGWLSCAEDFYHFGLAVMNEKLISKKYLDLMMTGYIEMPPGKYGYGLEIYTDLMVPGKTVYGHNGGGMGFGCDLFFEPETKTIVATMLNMFGNSRFVTRNFMATAFGNEPQKPEKDKRQILFDMIKEKGLDDFDAHYQEYFKTIGMEQPNPFLLISFADGYDLLGQSENRKKYLNTLKKMIPENAVLYIQLGDIEAKEKQNEIAKSYYTKARELAEKNEPMLLGEIETKLKSL